MLLLSDPRGSFPILESGIIGTYTGLLVGVSLIVSISLASTQSRIDIIGVGTSIATGLATAGVLSTHEIECIQQLHTIEPIDESGFISQLQAIGLERHFIAGVTEHRLINYGMSQEPVQVFLE